jgi:nucleoside 2-deoxyribosyltransferase
MKKYKFYLAAPLFTDAEKEYNFHLYQDLGHYFEWRFGIYLPQANMAGSPQEIFLRNMNALLDSDAVIAICDGADVDSGTAWEVGKFHGRGNIYVLRTDFRKSGDDPDTGLNLMISQSATEIFTDRTLLITYLIKNRGRE